MPHSDSADETLLIRAAQRGDLAAFGALVERHQGSVRACLAVRMNHAPDAEDLAQEALLDTQLDADFHAGRESEKMHALRECLEELDGPARALVRERYADGTSLDDLAARLGRKTSAVSMQLHRLRGLLGDCIAQRLATP